MSTFTYVFKENTELTSREIEDMFALNVKMYPSFEEIYRINKYYSYVKPKKLMMVYSDGKLVADANYSWRSIYSLQEKEHKVFAYFGILVNDQFHNQGIGSEIIARFQAETKEKNFTGLFATTQDEVMKHLFDKFNFQQLQNQLIWFNPQTDSHELVAEQGYQGFWGSNEVKGDWIFSEPTVFLGTGPI